MQTPLPIVTNAYLSTATLLLCFALSWPVTAQEESDESAVTVQLHTKDGEVAGQVQVTQLENGTLFVAELRNLPPGGHGFHIHEQGKCQPDFEAAGGHFNPSGAEHGLNNEDGYHAGDLPNIYVSEDGTAKAAFFAPHLSLESGSEQTSSGSENGPFSLMDEDGSSVILHQNPDDYVATPPDSTGQRIACGVLAAADPQ